MPIIRKPIEMVDNDLYSTSWKSVKDMDLPPAPLSEETHLYDQIRVPKQLNMQPRWMSANK